jgi:putative sigma-54 modulation protein
MTVTQAMHDQVVNKMQRLDKYLDRLQSIDVELCKEHTRATTDKNQVEVIAHVPGHVMRVTTSDADMIAAVDEAVDKLYRQLNRTKERMKAHHGVKPAEVLALPSEVEPELETETAEGVPLHIERLEINPLFEDEAIEELENQRRGFYVFLNARNERINVLYRREDGSYALIEPRAG